MKAPLKTKFAFPLAGMIDRLFVLLIAAAAAKKELTNSSLFYLAAFRRKLDTFFIQMDDFYNFLLSFQKLGRKSCHAGLLTNL